MVSFQCDNCGDVVKKPKAAQHRGRCRSTLTCIDCSTTFQGNDFQSHNTCISEAEKYQKSLYKKKGGNKNNNNNNKKNGNANSQQPEKKQQEAPKPNDTDKKKDTSEPSKKPDTKKPISLVDQLKQQQNGKRKSSDEDSKPEEESPKKKAKWEDMKLPADQNKQVEFALKEAVKQSKEPLTLKAARKKFIKLIQSHPEAQEKSKDKLKEKFDENLVLSIEGDNIIVKTA